MNKLDFKTFEWEYKRINFLIMFSLPESKELRSFTFSVFLCSSHYDMCLIFVQLNEKGFEYEALMNVSI